MKILEKIFIEKETVSDVDYNITEVYVRCGEKIKEGVLILSFETSKADVDVESPCSGVVVHNLASKAKLFPGDVAFLVVDEANKEDIESLKNEYFSKHKESVATELADVRFSKNAEKILKENDLRKKDFAGKTLVKEKDVLEFLAQRNKPIFDLKSLGKAKDNDVILIGGRGGAKMVIDAFRSRGNYKVKAILDDSNDVSGEVLGVPVIGGTNLLEDLLDWGYKNMVLCFGNIFNRATRLKKYKEWKRMGFSFPNVIHKNAIVESSATIGEGNIILAGAIIGSEARIGDLNYINTGAILSHECQISENIHLAPGATVGGRVNISNNTLIGMNSIIYFDVNIGSNVTINNGISVTQNILNDEIIK